MTTRPRVAPAVRWLLVLFVASAAVLIGGSSRAQATSRPCLFPQHCPTTTTTTAPPSSTTSTTLPPTGQTGPYSASFTPCTSDGGQSGSAPCTVTPEKVQVFYPPGAPPDEVQVNWVATGRSEAAPNPGSTSATLSYQDGSSCGTDLVCWPWPTALDDGPFILNGTYQVVVCLGSFRGACNNSLQPQSIGLAVPPGAPASVSAASAGSEVTVSWSPPAGAPLPDLVGYSVNRDGTSVYTCSTDRLGPGASTPCPPNLEVADHPGNGEYTYSVTALRLGVDTAAADVVSSSATGDTQGVVTVPGAGGSGPGVSGGSGPGGQSVPLAGGSAGDSSTGSGAVTQVTLGGNAASAPVVGASAPVPKLSYPTSSELAPKHPQALALKVDPSTTHNDVVPVAVLALGILSLAIAAHFLYLRVELGVVQAKLAARRASNI